MARFKIATASADLVWNHNADVQLLFTGDSVMTLEKIGSQGFTGNRDVISAWIVFAVLLSSLTLVNTF